METKFQTSFIPKKPFTPPGAPVPAHHHHHGTGLFMTIAVFVFIVSIAGAGGAYAWKIILASYQDSYKKELANREKQFNVDLIEQLKQANIKIDLAKQIITEHLALSQVFDVISRLTIENVRFLNLDLTSPSSQNPDIKVSLQGYGTSFSAVAFQSDVLSQLDQYNLRKVVKNPIISDPTLSSNGTVSFGFTASLDPASLSYEKSIIGEASTTP